MPMSYSLSFRAGLLTLVCLVMSSACMRVEPNHPYDSDSPPEYRAKASLISALYSSEIHPEFDYSTFVIDLVAIDFDASYSQRADLDGRFSFQGIMPGRYYLSTEADIEGELYGIKDQEVFLPVGDIVKQAFFDISPLD